MFKKNVNRIARRVAVEFIFLFFSLLLRVRYRIVVENHQNMSLDENKGGILFIGNHTSLLDAIIIGATFWNKYHMLPVIVDDHYFISKTHWFFKLMGLPHIPNFSSGTNDLKEQSLKEAKEKIGQCLQEGKNVGIYPSGMIKITSKELLGGSSLVPYVLQKFHPREVIHLRLFGMWGSSFSWGYTGKAPNLYEGWGKRFLQVLVNGIFFMPKRKIVIHWEKATLNPDEGFISINQKLENFYNAPYPEGEPLSLVPYYFWKKSSQLPTHKTTTKSDINQALANEIIHEIATILSVPESDLSLETRLGLDLGMDSLDLARLMMHFENKYDLGVTSMQQFYYIGDFVRWIEGKNEFYRPFELKEFYLPKDAKKVELKGCGDLWNAPYSPLEFEKLVRKLSKQCEPIRSRQVGVMMLNSVESVALIKALQNLGKIPVLIDWLESRNFKEEIHQKFPSLPIVTTRFVINTFNFVDVDGLSEQLFWLNETKALRRFKGESHPSLENQFLQYFAKEGKEVELRSFPNESYNTIASEIQNLCKEAKVALIHSFTEPREVIMNLTCLDTCYERENEVFFLSSYRVSGRELFNFLNAWKIGCAICDSLSYERLKKFKDLKTKLFLFDDLLVNGEQA